MIWNRPLTHSVAWAAGSVVLAAAIVGVHTVPARRNRPASSTTVHTHRCRPFRAVRTHRHRGRDVRNRRQRLRRSGRRNSIRTATCSAGSAWGTPRVDVEDLSSTPDGHLWLADTGDNNAYERRSG